MKKIIALALALVMAFGMIACGAPAATETPAATEAPAAETPAATEAPAATETPAVAVTPAAAEAPSAAETPAPAADGLRAGESVNVATVEEFLAAYTDLYKENSTVNEIKLSADLDLTAKDLAPVDSPFPVWDKVTYLVVHMPEGTQLDLNGFKLRLRGLQGKDTTKDNSMGKVIDSFGGGSIMLYTWGNHSIVSNTLKVAKLYPGIVTCVGVTNTVENSADYDYIIPEGVQLSLGNPKSALVANSITFKSGATLKVGEKCEVGVTGTKSIIFECKNEADHNRQGIEFATEVKDV